MSCCVCGKVLSYPVEGDQMPLCEDKECIKQFVEVFGRFCQAVIEEAGMASDGFFYNGKLIRYDHFNEDFEKIWAEEGE